LSNIIFEHASISSETKFHKVNQDFHGVYSGEFGEIFIVTRGIGNDGCEIISHLATITIKNLFEKLPAKYDSVLALKIAFQNATKEVLSHISKHQWLSNSGATVAMVLKNSQGVYLAHAGDCRIFLLRKNKITCLTKDHFSYKDISQLTNKDEEAKNIEIPVIYNTIGMTNVEPEIIEGTKLYKGDTIFITTKGVYQRATRHEMIKAFENCDLTTGMNRLWEFAKDKKAQEDFTMIALKVANAAILPMILSDMKKEKMRFYILCGALGLGVLFWIITLVPYF